MSTQANKVGPEVSGEARTVAPAPSRGQLRWLEAGLGLFCHFGINTFFDREWSDGSLPVSGFAPTDFSARQWVETAVAGGFRYLVLTAKHHDGFCIWPTDTTSYSVSSSPFRGGRGDVVAEVAEACRDAGIGLGLYCSPWDRNASCYPDAKAYDRFYLRQLTELCTRYGELFELWFDGAGSEGRTYDWDSIMEVVDRHQPGAMVFNMGRPTIRWVGNEDGVASDPNPLCVDRLGRSAFTSSSDMLEGLRCVPAECPVAIRQNWFWHADDVSTLKSAEHLMAIYHRSVGLGSNLLLNMGPDVRGRISDEDAGRWQEAWQVLRRRFATPRLSTLTRGPRAVVAEFEAEVDIDHVELREDLSHGQRVKGFRILGDGVEIASGTTIGFRRTLRVKPCRVRHLTVTVGPDAELTSVTAFDTGGAPEPQLGAKLDYKAWAAKADIPSQLAHNY